MLNCSCSRRSKLVRFDFCIHLLELKKAEVLTFHILSLFIPGFFSGEDSAQLAEFLKVSGALRDSYRFAHSTDMGLSLKYGVDGEYV